MAFYFIYLFLFFFGSDIFVFLLFLYIFCRLFSPHIFSWRRNSSVYRFLLIPFILEGGGVVDNMLDYRSRDREIDTRFSGLSEETLNRGSISYDLIVGGTLNPSSLTHSVFSYSRNCPCCDQRLLFSVAYMILLQVLSLMKMF